MWAMLKDLAENGAGDLRRGMNAPTHALMAGKLAALAVSVPLIVVLALLPPLNLVVAIVIGAFVQLFLGWAIAGREERRKNR